MGKQKNYLNNCLQCGKEYWAFHKWGRFCSRDCQQHQYAYQKPYRQCQQCGKDFRIHKKTSCYCSRKCQGLARRTRGLGDEKIITKPSRSVPYTYILTGWYENGTPIWKRKAVIVLEQLLKRELSKAECLRIKFLDGDTLNCELSNLLLPCSTQYFCLKCQKPLSFTQGSIPVTRQCLGCLHEVRPYINATLTKEEAACIKSLVKQKHYISHAQIGNWFLVSYSCTHKISTGETWKGVKPMAATKTWKTLLAQHDKLKKQAGGCLFDRVTLLQHVYNDPAFSEAMLKQKKQPLDVMNDKINDVCANFTELVQILKMFPRRSQWLSGNIYDMREKMIQSIRKQQEETCKANPSPRKERAKETTYRKTATYSQLVELEQENKEKKTEVEHLKEQLTQANQLISILESQLQSAKETIGNLNETISLMRMQYPSGGVKGATQRRKATK